jgi:hypothetical protein
LGWIAISKPLKYGNSKAANQPQPPRRQEATATLLRHAQQISETALAHSLLNKHAPLRLEDKKQVIS